MCSSTIISDNIIKPSPIFPQFLIIFLTVRKKRVQGQYCFKEKSWNREVFDQKASKYICFGKTHDF